MVVVVDRRLMLLDRRRVIDVVRLLVILVLCRCLVRLLVRLV